MDLDTVTSWRAAYSREELRGLDTGPGRPAAVLAGGTWLFGAANTHLTSLVDITTLGWPAVVVDETGLELAATCTIAELDALAAASTWPTASMMRACVAAFASSPKVWALATVGGNVVMALPAGPMTSMLVSLDATALVWGTDGVDEPDRRVPVEDLVLGPQRSALRPGEVLRSFHIPIEALTSRTSYRRIALTSEGRSGAIVVARLDSDGPVVLTITAATARPVRLAFARLPSRAALTGALDDVDCWYDDHHGSAVWREAMCRRFAVELVDELRWG